MSIVANIETDDIVKAVRSGVAFPCAMCLNWWRAKEEKKESCMVFTGGKPCGGPMAGMAFPMYKGPLVDSNWTDFCFVCGEEVVAAVEVKGSDRMLGVCKKHVGLLEKLKPSGGSARTVKHEQVHRIKN